ncbi:winged helix-turn-helix transcriptional regulator [Actinomadura rupiterrae]|uniref:winged helix-turn-helix transcriptional regulator n=1 Tax=Actinomadura rupiterrae TaxID=559627 RepID=UPI0035568E59
MERADAVGRRWAATVLRGLLGGAVRFSDIAAAVPDMTHKLPRPNPRPRRSRRG